MEEICILGAGPVGCSLGVMLRQRGYDVSIYERYPDIREVAPPAGRSINLVLTARGVRLATKLGLSRELLSKTVKVSGRMMHSLDGKVVYQAYGRAGQCNFSIDRTLLNKFWISEAEKAGCNFHFEHRATSFDSEKGTLYMEGPEGARNELDMSKYVAVFASDGGGSVVRNGLVKSGLVAATESLLPTGYKEVVFPSRPDGGYSMDADSLHIWARDTHMLMALANTDGSFTGTIYLDHDSDDHPCFKSACASTDAALEYFEKYFPDALQVMDREVAASNFVDFKQGILGTVRCSPWAVGIKSTPVCLIGDSAHAIVPFFGQGVNCGFEDVFQLAQLIEETGGDLKSAIFKFSDSRKVESDAIADLALDNFEEMRSKVANPQFLLRKRLDAFIMDLFPTKYRTRYTLVMYSYNPYSVCLEMGEIQQGFLELICKTFGIEDLNDDFSSIDVATLEGLIDEHISPAALRLGVSFDF